MHTWYYRLNALFTVATTVLAVMCGLASVTEILHSSDPAVSARLVRLDGLSNERGNDRAWITLDVNADLRSIFNWNTKQTYVYVTVDFWTRRNEFNSITVYDRIVQSVDQALIRENRVKVQWPFTLTDQGNGLRGKPFNITVSWEKIPNTGLLLADKRVFTGFTFPQEYTGRIRQSSDQWS